uniref:Macro domain-containing protein n=1 Tax=Glossina palpalis gambiensis TaxID=67801 RepID=A0A1B0B5X7_9MUSC
MRLDTNSNEDFKTLNPTFCRIKPETLSTWGESARNDTRLPNTDYTATIGGPRHNCSPFPISTHVNNRFILWDGDITLLEADTITNTTNETLSESNTLSESILNVAECRTGEVRVTKGYNLPAKYILHTVGPTFKEKFKTAAENTLHCCYRNVLCKAKELNLKTIAVCNVSTNQKSFPADLAAHIALRTIRRFLDKYTTQIVIFCLNSHEHGIYEVLAPLYFPRNRLEERSALWQLPKDIGGEYGEPLHPDRQIRIIRNPQHSVLMRQDKELTEKNMGERFIYPNASHFSMVLIGTEIWEIVPDTSIEFESWEHVTDFKIVKLAYEGTRSDPVSDISEVLGFLVTALVQKIYLWQLKDEEVCGVVLFDTNIYVHQTIFVKSLILIADVYKSVGLLRFQEDFQALSLASRDDDSDNSPHDFESCVSDLEYGLSDLNNLNYSSYSGGGMHSHIQADLDRQHLLGDTSRNSVYEKVVADGIEDLEHQERADMNNRLRSALEDSMRQSDKADLDAWNHIQS